MNAISPLISADRSLAAANLVPIKQRQQAAWSAGDYSVIGTTLQIVGETLCESLDLRSTERVLDVAAGNGNATLAAARRGCEVVSTDYAPALLEQALRRAGADGLAAEFRVADAEALPFDEGHFDVVLSTFGVMFTPNQELAASELVRVCRRQGGRIGLANWMPEGFIGQLFKVIGTHVPPAAGVRSPGLWGQREWLADTFTPLGCSLRAQPSHFVFRYRSPEHWLQVFRSYYGPMLKAFEAVGAEGERSLSRDLLSLVARFNRAIDGSMVVPSAYLEVVILPR